MKKSEVYVKINSKKEAKQAKAILEALGEEISQDYWPIQECLCTGLGEKWYLSSTDWGRTKITLKHLIELLVKGDYTPEKTAVKVNNAFEYHQIQDYRKSNGLSISDSKYSAWGKDAIIHMSIDGDLDYSGNPQNDYNIIDYADFARENGLALKPTEIRFYITHGQEVLITEKEGATILDADIDVSTLTLTDIEAIHSAMQSLK